MIDNRCVHCHQSLLDIWKVQTFLSHSRGASHEPRCTVRSLHLTCVSIRSYGTAQFVHSPRELLSKKKSPVCDAFDSNVNNSNAVFISSSRPYSRDIASVKIQHNSNLTKKTTIAISKKLHHKDLCTSLCRPSHGRGFSRVGKNAIKMLLFLFEVIFE